MAAVIIVAAGQGSRMNMGVNKQYLPLCGYPLLYYSLSACLKAGCFEQIVVVVAAGEEKIFHEQVASRFQGVPFTVVTGSEERQGSVSRGLSVVGQGAGIVCIHDGARPLAAPSLFVSVVEAAREKGAAITAVPVKDTIKKVSGDNFVERTLPRDTLKAVQTPQAYRRQWLEEAYSRAQAAGVVATDDAGLLERCEFPVYVLNGDNENIKITTQEDLEQAEAIMRRRATCESG